MRNIDQIQSVETLNQKVGESKFGIVGMGNIGRATALGLLQSGFLSKDRLWISNRTSQETEAKCQGLDVNNITIAQDNKTLVQGCDVIFIALKQKQMREELISWKEQGILDKDKLLVSFAAGVRIDTIKKWVGNLHQPIIRVMPNTPVAVGKGVFGWTVSDEVTAGQIRMFQYILSNLGTECLVATDEDIDKITAISGSGPAYIYRLIEYMIQVAKDMGFSENNATKLVMATFAGAAELLLKSNESPEKLRERITSKGGTTEAAIVSFNSNNLFGVIRDGINAAKNKANELGQYFDSL